ncbi:RDAC family protein [Scatolibacter rhodanostii]|uniref:RDAC family protein n=1 Tax=Scatolibacter rhodanostii TaxID=2014781 RepID=UPI000C07B2C0|nr:hypothetical protein [Scatolibacter rhodanostii]
MAKIIGIHEIIELNHALKEKEFPFQVHLRDACGGQTMWLENMAANQAVATEKLQAFLSDYFAPREIKLAFSTDGERFWAVN